MDIISEGGITENKAHYSPWWAIIIAVTFTGATSLIYEVLAARILELNTNGSLYSITTVLIVFLGGLGLGAGVMSAVNKKYGFGVSALIVIQIAIALYAGLLLTQYGYLTDILNWLNNIIDIQIWSLALVSISFLLIPTFLIGSIFPLAAVIIESLSSKNISKKIGLLYTADIIGAVAGAAVAGFWLIPNYGITITLLIASIINFLGTALLIKRQMKTMLVWLLLFVIFVCCLFIIAPRSKNFTLARDDAYDKNVTVWFNKKDILYQSSSPYGLITVREELLDGKINRVLSINNRDQCQSASNSSEMLIAEAAMSHIKNDAKVLHIGLGCGFTLQKILEYETESVDVAEINRVIPAAAERYFSEFNNNSLADERVDIIIEDGAKILKEGKKTYDVIIIDIENPTIAHSSPLYTYEYFEYARQRLAYDGSIALWGYQSEDPRYLKSLIGTLRAVFEHVDFIQNNAYILVASQLAVNLSEFDKYGTKDDLKNSLETIEAVPINTIDHPVLETYYKP